MSTSYWCQWDKEDLDDWQGKDWRQQDDDYELDEVQMEDDDISGVLEQDQ